MISPRLLKWRMYLLAGVLAGMPTVVFAQLKPEQQTGSHIPVSPQAVQGAEAGLIKKAFARCIYKSNTKAAVAILSHSDSMLIDLKGANIADLSGALNMSDCLGEQAGATQNALGFKFKRDMLRGLLSEEAYLSGHSAVPTLPVGGSESTGRNFVSEGENLAKARALAAFSDCIVFTDVGRADALLRTMPESVGERAAARALAPTLGKCLDQGVQFSMTPTSIRVYVADGLWNRFSRPQSAQAATATKP